MRFVTAFLLMAMMVVLSGCNVEERERMANDTAGQAVKERAAESVAAAEAPQAAKIDRGYTSDSDSVQTSMVVSASQVQAATSPIDRKVIRNAELSIEVDSPTAGQSRITSIAESLGGFVVTSEFKQQDGRGQTRSGETVTVIVRVPSTQFGAALEQIRSVGSRVIHEKVASQDVTEEYIDLEARIRTKKALEAQFLEIMKQARKVSEALEVQSEIAEVRTEIERLEGRRRFLENQSALSTINITLQMPAPLVTATTSGFGADIKQAFGDGVDTGAAIISGLIRLLIVMVPITLFVLLPAVLIGRYLIRRFNMTGSP